MLKSLNFKTNIKKFAINNDEDTVISVNTSDIGILERAKKSENMFAEVKAKYENAEKANAFELMADLDKSVRNQINYIFGSDVSTAAFGTANCVSTCDGVPMYVGFLNAIMAEVRADLEAENEKTKAHINKYVSQVKK